MGFEGWFQHRPIATGFVNPYRLDLKAPRAATH
ncbi:MAG: hypothetical protein QOE61_746, partial [Micromonosporaceae bacterium]|nr:hypothetical protein [Micromonosporaceae bacterium]